MPVHPPSSATPSEDVTALANEIVRHARLLHVVKAQFLASAPHGLDGAAVSLLMQLVKCGPRRQGELAAVVLLDTSTVSRYVGQLVKAGLVERRPDPDDGRAVQLAATPAGEEAARRMVERRNRVFATVVADWDDDDVHTLTRLLARLNDDVETARPRFADLEPATSQEI